MITLLQCNVQWQYYYFRMHCGWGIVDKSGQEIPINVLYQQMAAPDPVAGLLTRTDIHSIRFYVQQRILCLIWHCLHNASSRLFKRFFSIVPIQRLQRGISNLLLIPPAITNVTHSASFLQPLLLTRPSA